MIDDVRRNLGPGRLWPWLVAAGVLLGAVFFGLLPSVYWLLLLAMGLAGIVLIQQPLLGLLILIPTALVVAQEFGTGTEVALNLATLLVPALLGLWLLDGIRRRGISLAHSRVNKPLALFLLAGLLSFLLGSAFWDPAVPRTGNLVLVQLAQWSICAFSAGAFWLSGNLIKDEVWLRRLSFLFLALAGGVAILMVLTGGSRLVGRGILTTAFVRASLWMLIAALAGGQLLFNKKLSTVWRVFLLIVMGAVLVYVFYFQQKTASNWIGVSVVLAILGWLRWPRLRWFVLALCLLLAVTGVLSSAVYDFAGGEAEWQESGGSRLVLIGRVVEVTMRNPITGLGPAAYRSYAGLEPLLYGRALWLNPLISSHNNYVDLFSHGGLLGLGLFVWFAVELFRLGFRLRARFVEGFATGYVNGMLAAWAGALILMLFADWILPFVYNIGFQGFQASVLIWLFLGGLVALEQMDRKVENVKPDMQEQLLPAGVGE